jgi:hypothetical protein
MHAWLKPCSVHTHMAWPTACIRDVDSALVSSLVPADVAQAHEPNLLRPGRPSLGSPESHGARRLSSCTARIAPSCENRCSDSPGTIPPRTARYKVSSRRPGSSFPPHAATQSPRGLDRSNLAELREAAAERRSRSRRFRALEAELLRQEDHRDEGSSSTELEGRVADHRRHPRHQRQL